MSDRRFPTSRSASRTCASTCCFNGLADLAPLLGTAIPLGVYNFTEAMSNVESAAAAGDNFNLRSVLLADGAGAVVGSAFGSPFPPAVYIGHPGWKDAGGRAGYSLASGVVIGILCFLGLFGVLDALLPVPAIVPILLYIGLLIGAQAFQAVPRLHAIAVVAAILPNLAQWAHGLIDNALNAAGTSATEVGMEALNGAGVVYEGLKTLGEGAVLVGLILGTMVTFILEKKFLYAAIASAVGAVLSFIGLIHAPEVAWAASPAVALGYVFFGVVCVAYCIPAGRQGPGRGRRIRHRGGPLIEPSGGPLIEPSGGPLVEHRRDGYSAGRSASTAAACFVAMSLATSGGTGSPGSLSKFSDTSAVPWVNRMTVTSLLPSGEVPAAITPLVADLHGSGAPVTTVLSVAELLWKFESAAATSGKTRMVSMICCLPSGLA